VRATDEGLASMPRDMYWNATSMMDNWWFRVAVHRDGDTLRFEHPTLAGTAAGGWMERMNEEGEDPRYPVFEKTEKTEAAPGEGGRYFEVRGSSSGGTPAARWESVSGGTRKRSAATKRRKQAHTGLAAPELRSTSSARRQRWRLVVP